MSIPPDSANLIYGLLDVTRAIHDRTEALIGEVLADLDLTHALANALWKLDPDAEPPSMRALAASLRCDPSTVTFLADRLEEKGLIFRHVDARNRRVKTLVLTPKGRNSRHCLIDAMASHSPAALLPPEDQEQLYHLLYKAMAASAAERPQHPPPARPTGPVAASNPSQARQDS